jgi:hypothetical protein
MRTSAPSMPAHNSRVRAPRSRSEVAFVERNALLPPKPSAGSAEASSFVRQRIRRPVGPQQANDCAHVFVGRVWERTHRAGRKGHRVGEKRDRDATTKDAGIAARAETARTERSAGRGAPQLAIAGAGTLTYRHGDEEGYKSRKRKEPLPCLP